MESQISEEASISFIMKLKKILKPKDYKAFIDVLFDYRAQRICTADMLMSVNQVLCFNEQLVSGFDAFFLEEYRIVVAAAASPEILTWFSVKKASVDFFNKVRTTYHHGRDNDDTYRAFISIMGKYLNNDYNIKKVHDEVSDLFQDNPSLFSDFTILFSDQNPEKPRNSTSRRTEKEKIRCNKNDNLKWLQHEDKLFEMDMEIGYLESTIKQSEQFLGDYDNMRIGAALEEYFRVHEIKCIKNVYGGRQGEDMAAEILPLLRQKLEESRDKHEGYKSKLRRIYESKRQKRDDAL